MKRSLSRVVAVAASGLAGVTGLVLGAGAASAATPTIGSLSISPSTGVASTPFNLVTSAGCPAGDKAASAVVNATGWGTDTTITGPTTVGVSTSGSFSLGINDTVFGTANADGFVVNPGKYTFSVLCRPDTLSDPNGAFVGSIYFTGTASQGATQPYQTFNPNPATTSSTVLTVAPTSPSTVGQSVTLSAAVTLTPTGTVPGTVQFKDGGANLGSPVAVSAGSASLVTSALTAGSHSLTAVYSGAQEVGTSTSNTVTYAVNSTTTTTLSGPATAPEFSSVNYTVTTPAGANGSVALYDGTSTSPLASAPVTSTTTVVPVAFSSLGDHSIVAKFTPTGNFAPSRSAAVVTTVTAPAGITKSETIETTIAPGTLTMSVDSVNTVVLPSPTLDDNAGLLTTSGAINPVTVTDTRAGAPGFTVTGVLGDFVDGTSDKIDGANLGWTPNVVGNSTGMVITPGAAVAPAPGIQPGGTYVNTLGLKFPRTLATNAAGHNGTAHLGAGLSLAAPTNVAAGTYDATLTLTAI